MIGLAPLATSARAASNEGPVVQGGAVIADSITDTAVTTNLLVAGSISASMIVGNTIDTDQVSCPSATLSRRP
jgi:hypothetical protein